jgi:hypothetical protein
VVPSDRIDPVILGHILGHHRELHSRLLTLKAAYAEPVAAGPQRMDAVAKLLKPGALLIGAWFVNPEMDPGESGPPFGISPEELDALFAEQFEVVESYTPEAAYPGREGRELLRVLRLSV